MLLQVLSGSHAVHALVDPLEEDNHGQGAFQGGFLSCNQVNQIELNQNNSPKATQSPSVGFYVFWYTRPQGFLTSTGMGGTRPQGIVDLCRFSTKTSTGIF